MKFSIPNRYYFTLGICILLGVLFNWKYLNNYPSFIHAWSQSDHYSITLGFLENGLNFFKPQTLIYNHQFPDWWASTTETGITSVDFPIHHYIPAVIMEITGFKQPIISRLYTFLYSIFGLLAVYKLTYYLSKSQLKSIFVIVFAATSPVFIYYQASFLPSIPSFSNALWGVYFYILYLGSGKNRNLKIAIGFLTLAALSRTTFVIPLIAVFSNEFLRVILKETTIKDKILPVFCSIGIIAGYFAYNTYLRTEYSSIFIGNLLPPESLNDFFVVLKEIMGMWFFQYFSAYHYLIGIFLLIGVFLFRKQVVRVPFIKQYLYFVSILMFGLFLFLIAMEHAFIHHDYYFIDTYFLPCILLLSLCVSLIPKVKVKQWNFLGYSIVLIFGVIFSHYALQIQNKRRIILDYDNATYTKISYEKSKEYLSSLGVPEKAKILAIDVCAPNVPFVMMGRRGHGVFYPTKENIEKALTWDFDYVVTQNAYFLERTLPNFPELINHLTVLGNNGRITVSKYNKTAKEKSLSSYLLTGLDAPHLNSFCNYSDVSSLEWTNVSIVETDSLGMNTFGVIKPDELYGITFKKNNIEELTSKSNLFRLKARVKLLEGNTTKFALDVKEKKTVVFSKLFELDQYLNPSLVNEWQEIELLTMLPILNSNNNMLSLFLWNPDKNHLLIDDVRIELY